VRFCVVVPLIVRLPGKRPSVALEVACTCTLADVKPGAVAVMIDDPTSMPFTLARLDVVAPCAMKTLSGVTLTFDGLLLVSVMNTPPSGAGAVNVTGNAADWPSATATLAGRTIPDTEEETVTLTVALGIPVALAEMVADPPATPVTGTATLVAFAPKLTVAGTVATPVLLELRLIVKPPAGAGDERFSVRF
jgi:hypothetical protein